MSKGRTSRSAVKEFRGAALRWEWRDGVVELTLDFEPLNEIGTVMLADLEKFVAAFDSLAPITSACVITSARPGGFCAGANLKELYQGALPLSPKKRATGMRAFLKRIHVVMNALDAAPFVTIAAVHGLCMGGGLELALVCDLIVADKMARFGFPELRLGLIPGFGGIPRLRRDRQWLYPRSALHRPDRQGRKRAAGGPRVASRGRRLRAASGAFHGAAGDEV